MRLSPTKIRLTIWLVFMLSCVQIVKPERWDGSNNFFFPYVFNILDTLYDLEGNGTDFLAQANLWNSSGLKNPSIRVSTCNGTDILGGYNIQTNPTGQYFERTYTGLPAHNQISFYINIFPVDSWDSNVNDHFNIQIDNQTIVGWAIEVYLSTYNHDICGSTVWQDLENVHTYITIPHNSSSVKIKVISLLDQWTDNESLGFRDLILTFDTVNTPTNKFCGRTIYPLPRDWCSCNTSQYMQPAQSGRCFDCHTSCLTCTGPNSNACTSCRDGFYLSSGSCLPCHSTCATCNGGAFNKCLTCHDGDYLVGNNTCVSTCPAPFYKTSNATEDFCETPCPGQFAFKDLHCSAACSGLFQSYTLAILKSCVCYSAGAAGSDPCYSCDVSCNTCNGTAANQCLSCFDGYYLNKTTGLITGTCEPCHSTCATCYGPAANQCLSCHSNAFLVLDNTVNNGTCSNCDSSCATCNGPTTIDCLTCRNHYYFVGNTAPAVDGACLPCDSTCSSCNGSSFDQCLTCYPGSFLVSNNTCITQCVSPFFSTTDGTNTFCETPCPGRFAYEDQTCTNTCVSTLYQPRVTAVVLKACICTDFKYDNFSCLATCNRPMTTRVVQNGSKYCDFGCNPGQFLYYDGTCEDNCSLPQIPRIEGDKFFCDHSGCEQVDIQHIKITPTGHMYRVVFIPSTCDPEAALIQEILNTNADLKTALNEPEFRVTKNKRKQFIVDLKLKQSVLEDISINVKLIELTGVMYIPKKLTGDALSQNLSSVADIASTSIAFLTGSSIITSLTLKNTASAWGFVGFQQFITFFKYAFIDYPLHLELFFMLGGATDFAAVPNLLDKMVVSEYTHLQENEDLLDELNPPQKFFYYNATSFFIKNGGSTFLSNWIALGLVLLIVLIRKVPKLKENKILEKADGFIRWNFVLRTFMTVSLPLSISILLQLRALNGQETYLSISSALAMIALVHYLAMYAFIFHILRKVNFKDTEKNEVDPKYTTLFNRIDPKTNHAKYYHSLIMLRGFTLAIMVVFGESIPLMQVLVLMLFNVGLVFYVFKKAEFQERREKIKIIITEIFIIPMEICFALLLKEKMTENYYRTIGWVACGLIALMFVNELIFALTTQFIAIRKGLLTLRDKLRELKKKKAKATGTNLDDGQVIKTREGQSGVSKFAASPEQSQSPTSDKNPLLDNESITKEWNRPKNILKPRRIVERRIYRVHPIPISQDRLVDNGAGSDAEGISISQDLTTDQPVQMGMKPSNVWLNSARKIPPRKILPIGPGMKGANEY